MGKESEGLEERPKAKIHMSSLRTTVKKNQICNYQAMMAYIDSS